MLRVKNLIERAYVLFGKKEINADNVKHNLLKIKVPIENEESDALWDAASDLVGISKNNDITKKISPPSIPENYRDWFSYYDNIDIRRHLQDIEIY